MATALGNAIAKHSARTRSGQIECRAESRPGTIPVVGYCSAVSPRRSKDSTTSMGLARGGGHGRFKIMK
jgi:hypothetical protein